MPRPLKSVPADTLGGRIRAARQRLHLSLAQVAGDKYSTSLISQLERNKIEPSSESLKYLAERLNLPLEELTLLAQQRRESEAEASKYQQFEDQRAQAAHLLDINRPRQALELLDGLAFTEIPTYLRWRIVALRGQCYFAQRKFTYAIADFLSAITFLPQQVAQEQTMEVVLLYLHLAATLRELGHYDAAYMQYDLARSWMDYSTPLRYVAEAHWGTSLVLYEQAYKAESQQEHVPEKSGQGSTESRSEEFRRRMEHARKHAENAYSMYLSANELLRAALLNCQVALIEEALHQLDAARQRLQAILDDWLPTLNEEPTDSQVPLAVQEKRRRYTEKERANVVSAAACYLASVEHEQEKCDQALVHVNLALEIGQKAYIVRRADAYLTKGQILAHRGDPQATEAFRQALAELKNTDRLGAIIRVHKLLGEHLIRQGRKEEGEAELEKAFALANVPTQFSATAADEYNIRATQDGESFINT